MTPSNPTYQYVGKSVLRNEGRNKVTGRAVYVDDIATPGALYAKTIRSTVACGRIKDIQFGPGIPWDEFTVVDVRDIPHNVVELIKADQPVLCDGVVRHREEPILLIAHPDKGMVENAAREIKITYEVEPAILEIGPGAVQTEYLIVEGDVDAAFASSDIVFEETYQTGSQEHVYIEPNGFIAEWQGDRIVLHGSLQCPYYVVKAVKMCFGIEEKQVEVIQETTGGGFGGKEEFPNVVALHAALLAKKSGKPVRLIYDRQEDMACSTKRHPSVSRVKIGVSRDGVLKALDFDFQIDAGAYVTLSPVVLSRGVLHAGGCYRWPAARIRGRSFTTNSPPYGAFRGFGAPQSLFATECAINAVADRLGMDPAEFRRKNFLHKGDKMPTGQVLDVEPNLDAMLDRVIAMSGWAEKRASMKKGSGRGVGLATILHGTGFTGSGEVYLQSRVALAGRADGKVDILVGSTEIGQGTETIFRQIAAEALRLPMEQVEFHKIRTSAVPNSGPTVASRTCSVVGRLVQRAAEQMFEKLDGKSVAEYVKANGSLRTETQFEPRPGLKWDDATYKGSAYGAYSWMCNVAEVQVDPVTATPKVETIFATVDIGTLINPTLAYGQVEGGVAQAVGWATSEKVTLRDGVMANCQMTNYIIPTSVDAPDIQLEFMPTPDPFGAFGAKGVGEMPMDGPAPAVTAAIGHAINKTISAIPATPEDLIS
ncbi:MAG: xanthine dehydrogenase family protein molybdopterin-binding subunit [Candidatus Sumerlaeaceae bacterium]|nr:xanthine dehydrogenase family protein molybdopterin-binding subunit [Candidatus Sumerlaeaceae bacterium]